MRTPFTVLAGVVAALVFLSACEQPKPPQPTKKPPVKQDPEPATTGDEPLAGSTGSASGGSSSGGSSGGTPELRTPIDDKLEDLLSFNNDIQMDALDELIRMDELPQIARPKLMKKLKEAIARRGVSDGVHKKALEVMSGWYGPSGETLATLKHAKKDGSWEPASYAERLLKEHEAGESNSWTLMRTLKHGSPSAKSEALDKLLEMGPPKGALEEILTAREDAYGDVAARIDRALRRLRGEAAQMVVDHFSDALNSDLKKLAFELDMSNAPTAERLKKWLPAAEAAIRKRAYEELVKLGPEHDTLYAQGLTDLDVDIRKSTLSTVESWPEARQRKVLPALYRALTMDKTEEQVAKLIEKLPLPPEEELPQLETLIDANKQQLRKYIAMRLKKIGEPCVPMLRKLLKSGQVKHRWWAAALVQDLGPVAGAASEELILRLDEKQEKDQGVFIEAMRALGAIGKHGVPAIPRLLDIGTNAKNIGFKRVAYKVLKKLRDHALPEHQKAIDELLAKKLPGILGVQLGPKLEVRGVGKGSGAANAGIRKGDQITSINGVPVSDMKQLQAQLADKYPGVTVRVGFRRGGRSVEYAVTLGE